MCGITGGVDFQGLTLEDSLLKEMTRRMLHRGPDDEGFFRDPFVAFGFRRLSIIDLKNGNQPMFNEDGNVVVLHNGEIYNFPELREMLIARGHRFKTHCDTEVIVHGYEEWGERCVEKFKGMFAFAIYDRGRKKMILGRDRLGIKPLYYAKIGRGLFFGSEMKAILTHPGFAREPQLSALSSYLTFRYPQGDQPVFAGMKRLLPGHLLVVTQEGERLVPYWEVPFYAKKEDRGEAYYLRRLEELLFAVMKRHMISDVPVGAYLSGGLDSSMVVAFMSRLSSTPINSFCIGFPTDGYNEGPYAERVSRHCGTRHLSILLSQQEAVDLLPRMIRIKDAPLSIPHEIALYQMSVEIKKHVTVVISGEGSDELFGGYGRVQRSPMDFKKIQFVQRYVPAGLKKRVISWLGAGASASDWLKIQTPMEHLFSVYHWIPFEEKWGLFSDEMNQQLQWDAQEIKQWELLFEKTREGNPYDQLLYLFEKNHLPCLLDRLDSMSMAASVEARVPFVDHELVEFVSTIPHRYKLRWRSWLHQFRALFTNSFQASERLDRTKDILRTVGGRLLPEEIAHRKKLGFPVPLDAWMKSGLVEKAKEILLDPRCLRRGLYQPGRLERFLSNPQSLDFDFWGKKVWMLMNVELWYREMIDRLPEPAAQREDAVNLCR
ncbi:MAG: asparagine synthase (glutamine-hydrolyzing) [Candidatus Omnitrophica bacterium]|nr:asparagine synthase (glutamine-hydrolyzing) [Candidatus Omnitrophota bacterium]